MRTIAKLMTTTLVLGLMLTTGCAKKRDAAFPDSEAPQIFAISDFGTLDAEKTGFTIKTHGEARKLSGAEKALAKNGNGLVAIESGGSRVPPRLAYMFRGLEIAAEAGREYKIVFAVDRHNVSAYKVVDSLEELSILERQRVTTSEEIDAEIKLQKSRSAAEQAQAKVKTSSARQNKSNARKFLVKIFSFKVEAFGVVSQKKNDLGEKTSTKQLEATDFSIATHVKLATESGKRVMQKDDDDIYVADRINNKVLTAGRLRDELGVSTGLNDDAAVLTLLGTKHLMLFEITTTKNAKLSAGELEALKAGIVGAGLQRCTEAHLNALRDTRQRELTAEERADCVIVHRLSYPISYVRARSVELTYESNRAEREKLEEVQANASVGLVRIPRQKEVLPIRFEGKFDPRIMFKKDDILGKEFFFRRTAAESSATAPIGAGFGGPVLIVKFELQEDRGNYRLVARRAEQVVEYQRDQRKLDKEEVLSFPVKLFAETDKDDSGNTLPLPQLKENVSAEEAKYLAVDWTKSQIPISYSALAFYAQASCFNSVNNQVMSDMDQRLKDGTFNFTIEYSVTMKPTTECISIFAPAQDYDPSGQSFELNQTVKERVSLVLNDKRTDKNFAPAVPFQAQNALGYGFFTTGKLRPTVNGLIGREGMEDNYAYTHDFRNGRKLVYVIGGLPENEGRMITVEGQTIDLRELYIDVARGVVADWNKALHRAFKGSSLERSGDYIEAVVNGENGVNAKLGDLDRNFIWFEETMNDAYPAGISQNGVNPRSGISVSDFMVMYSGVVRRSLESLRTRAKVVQQFEKIIEEKKKSAASSSGIPNLTVLGSMDSVSTGASSSVVETSKKISNVLMSSSFAQTLRSMKVQDHDTKRDFKPETVFGNKAALDRLFKKVLALGQGATAEEVELTVAHEMYTNLKAEGKLTPAEQASFARRIGILSSKKHMAHLSKTFPGCAFPTREELRKEYAEASYKDALTMYMKNILAHEMGHSLGLTHNFAGNVDPKNFKFSDESKYVRSASTVMDYLVAEDDHFYGGPGPYDVHALRAGYTGRVEVQDTNGKNTRLISMDEIRKAKGGNWMNVTRRSLSQVTSLAGTALKDLQVKRYRYCTDKDVMWDPDCNRFDAGRNPIEIVDNIRRDYDVLYWWAYNDHNRTSFNGVQAAGAFGRLISSMINARAFLEETFYRAAIEGRSDFEPMLTAAVESYKFLVGVVGTPDAPPGAAFNSPDRFQAVAYSTKRTKTDEEGFAIMAGEGQNRKPVTEDVKGVHVVEARQLGTSYSTMDRIETLGVETDKVFALQFLTLDGLPFPKYARASLALSYRLFEQLVLGLSPEKSLINQTLVEILAGRVTPSFSNRDTMGEVPNAAPGDVTITMRIMSAVMAVLQMDSQSAQTEKSNNATYFKVRSFVGQAPSDRLSIARIDSINGSSQRVSFAAVDNAGGSNALVRRGSGLQKIYSLRQALSQKIVSLRDALAKNESEAVTAAQQDLEKFLKESGFSNDLLLTTVVSDTDAIKVAVGGITSAAALTVHKDLPQILALYQAWTQERQGGGQIPDDAREAIKGLVTNLKAQSTNVTSALPLVGFAQSVLIEQTGENQVAKAFFGEAFAPVNVENDYNTIAHSLGFLSMLTRMTNPELH